MSITNQVQVVGIGAWLDDAGSVGATHTEAECCSIWAQTHPRTMPGVASTTLCIQCMRQSELRSAYADHALALCLRTCLFDCPANLTLSISSSSTCFTVAMSAGTWW